MKNRLVLILYLLAFNSFAAPDPIQKTFLRIEVGQHVARINRVAVDAGGTLLATASDDKTVRLWNVSDGSPYAVLRVPIGDGIPGELYAVAIAPDGKTLAAAGETGDKLEGFSLYFFDVEKRTLKARLSHLPSPIMHLAYSKDGQRIAAAFSGGFGVKLWNAGTGQLIASDDAYNERVTWLDFDSKNNLATVSYDGLIRLYDAELKLLRKTKPRAKALPYSIAYSNNNNLLAVGYSNLMELDLINAGDLKTIKTLKINDLAGKNAAVVAWQKNSVGAEAILAAGDMKNAGDKYIIRRWINPISAHPMVSDVAVADNIITDIVTLENATVDSIFVSADTSWGGMQNGNLIYKNQARLWDGRIVELANKNLRLSADGLIVEYPLEVASDKKLSFDASKMQLDIRTSGDTEGLLKPVTEYKSYKITNWQRSKPSFNGQPFKLDQHEITYALAIDQTTGKFLLGTDDKLRLFNDKGKELASIALPAPVYGVNVSGNGKLAVAALGDGTLHWFSLNEQETLQELATLFTYNAGKEWIVWISEGYFGHSDIGGHNLAGYHIDKGGNKRPDWIGFSQVYQIYYAPELIAPKLLRNEALIQDRLKSKKSPGSNLIERPVPIIDLTEFCVNKDDASNTRGFTRVNNNSPNPVNMDCTPIIGQGATRGFSRKDAKSTAAIYRNQLSRHAAGIKLHYKVTVRDGGIGNVDVHVNGKIQESKTPTSPREGMVLNLDSDVSLIDGENQIVVQAYEKTNGAAEKSLLINLLNPPLDVTPSSSAQLPKPKLIVTAIGIDRYGPGNDLKFAVKDATDFLNTMTRYKSAAYSKVVSFGKFDKDATSTNVDNAFDEIEKIADPEDTVLIYLSGHGIRGKDIGKKDINEDDDSYYFITYDIKLDASGRIIPDTTLSQQRMKQNIAKLAKVGKVFLFIDSCHSGAFKLIPNADDLKHRLEGVQQKVANSDDLKRQLELIQQEISSLDKVKHQLGENIFVLAASQSDQEALDQLNLDGGAKSNNGLFAQAVLEGLNGQARRIDDNIVDNYTLGYYVQRRVDVLSKVAQHPQKARFQAADASEILPFELTKPVN